MLELLHPKARDVFGPRDGDAWGRLLSRVAAQGMVTEALKSRLANQANVWPALAECLAADAFTHGTRLRLTTDIPMGSRGPLDFGLMTAGGVVKVEVKAPTIVENPKRKPVGDILREELKSANRQVVKGERNMVVVVPDPAPLDPGTTEHTRQRRSVGRYELLEILVGPLQSFVDPYDDSTSSDWTINPRGDLMRPRNAKVGPEPAFTGVSAVALVSCKLAPRTDKRDSSAGEVDAWEGFIQYLEAMRDGELEVVSTIKVIHNPHALCPLGHADLEGFPQLRVDDRASWSDGSWV